MKKYSHQGLDTHRLTLTALLIALQVILSKISVGSPSLVKFSLGFLATALIGYYLGPWLGSLALVLCDLISHTILSSGGGNFFLGFTFSAFLSGLIAGWFLYGKKITLWRLFSYQFMQLLIINTLLTTYWIHLLYHTSLKALLTVRIPKELISWPIQALICYFVLLALTKRVSSLKAK